MYHNKCHVYNPVHNSHYMSLVSPCRAVASSVHYILFCLLDYGQDVSVCSMQCQFKSAALCAAAWMSTIWSAWKRKVVFEILCQIYFVCKFLQCSCFDCQFSSMHRWDFQNVFLHWAQKYPEPALVPIEVHFAYQLQILSFSTSYFNPSVYYIKATCNGGCAVYQLWLTVCCSNSL